MEFLYTFFCEHAGNTYIRQLQACDEADALLQLAGTLGHDFGSEWEQEILSYGNAVDVSDFKHVWCFSAEIENELFLCHFTRC